MERHLCIHGLEDFISLRCWYYPKWGTDLMQSLKMPMMCLAEIEKSIWIFGIHLKYKEPQTGKTILKKNKVGGFRLPNFKAYYVTTVIKTVW